MPNKVISGSLAIPTTETSVNGIYTDLRLELVQISGNTEAVAQTATVSTSNTYSFTYDASIPQVRVQLVRVSTGVKLSETSTRGVLPRSFKLPSTDILWNGDFKHQNYLFDAGLAVLACAGGRYTSLGKEITDGILKAQKDGGALPFKANHVNPVGADAFLRTGTVAIAAYSLGYYLEKNPLATNKVAVGAALFEMLDWLTAQKRSTHGGLLIGGVGKYNGSVLDPNAEDDYATTVDNILAFFAFKQAGKMLNVAFKGTASALRDAIRAKLWDNTNHRFHAGTYAAGPNTTDNLETNYMGAFFMLEDDDLDNAGYLVDRIQTHFKAHDSVNNIDGYKAITTDAKVHYEGSYAVATLLYKMGDNASYLKIIKALNKTIDLEDGGFRYGVIKDGQYQVLSYKNVGSTAWSIITNMVPEEVFTVGEGTNIVPGLSDRYYSEERSGEFTKDDCPSGTGSTVTYTVPSGAYTSTVSVEDANAMRDATFDADGLAYARANGTCQLEYQYYNTERKGLFMKAGCPSPDYRGSVVEYTVPAGTYGSHISQAHANALADDKLRTEGQSLANATGACVLKKYFVNLTVQTSYIPDFTGDEYYMTVYADRAVATQVRSLVEYSVDGGATWIEYGEVAVNPGATNSASLYLTTVAPGTNVQVRIKAVMPTEFGNQIYVFGGSSPVFHNTERRMFFSRNCGVNNTHAGSVVEYVIPAGHVESYESAEHANALADALMAINGPAYAEQNGTCLVPVLVGNDMQSGTFTKQGCQTGYSGSTVTYTVPANTYQAATKTEANNMALADVAANGQNHANTQGVCVLVAKNIQLNIYTRVKKIYTYEEVYVQVNAFGGPVTDDLSIQYNYNINGVQHLGGVINFANGARVSEEVWLGQFRPGQGLNVQPFIASVSPNPDPSGTTYIF